MIKVLLLDIEGTTTSISFVVDVLFPYAKSHLTDFVRCNLSNSEVFDCVNVAIKTVFEEDGKEIDTDEAIKTFSHWISTDRKHPALKKLQGFIWKDGYTNGDYTAHIYDDVLPSLKKWKDTGVVVAIYSSGSIEAQKLLFKYTCFGDLTPLISNYFDLSTGNKYEAGSYSTIVNNLNVDSSEVLFLSDSVQELNAAKSIGVQTIQLLRPGTLPCDNHQTRRDFSEIELTDLD